MRELKIKKGNSVLRCPYCGHKETNYKGISLCRNCKKNIRILGLIKDKNGNIKRY